MLNRVPLALAVVLAPLPGLAQTSIEERARAADRALRERPEQLNLYAVPVPGVHPVPPVLPARPAGAPMQNAAPRRYVTPPPPIPPIAFPDAPAAPPPAPTFSAPPAPGVKP